jgi:hypothetical protein
MSLWAWPTSLQINCTTLDPGSDSEHNTHYDGKLFFPSSELARWPGIRFGRERLRSSSPESDAALGFKEQRHCVGFHEGVK